ncbi:MAG TPA: LamG-like jellyroll fold domain-containing protein, partial [Acetobacteraceae bacterium]|nr:LamG-like jellyroll fold domain-containing protein [Acetobacteraceae bacterium]
SSQRGFWTFPGNGAGVWQHIAVTYDNSSTSNTPVAYVNGVAQTVTRTQVPTGTGGTASNPLIVGAVNQSGTQTWDGQIAQEAFWNGIILGAAEVSDLANGAPPSSVQSPFLVSWCKLDGVNNPEFDTAGPTTAINGTRLGTSEPPTQQVRGLWTWLRWGGAGAAVTIAALCARSLAAVTGRVANLNAASAGARSLAAAQGRIAPIAPASVGSRTIAEAKGAVAPVGAAAMTARTIAEAQGRVAPLGGAPVKAASLAAAKGRMSALARLSVAAAALTAVTGRIASGSVASVVALSSATIAAVFGRAVLGRAAFTGELLFLVEGGNGTLTFTGLKRTGVEEDLVISYVPTNTFRAPTILRLPAVPDGPFSATVIATFSTGYICRVTSAITQGKASGQATVA